jgi:hypothetical protein
MKRGAVGVLNLLKLPGNELGKDFSNCGGVCFNIGGRDSFFLEQLLDSAAEKGVGDKVRAQMTLRAETRTGLTAKNAVAIVPGRNTNEAIVIDAHIDAWFSGAGDNGDGASVMLALAHFAKPEKPPRSHPRVSRAQGTIRRASMDRAASSPRIRIWCRRRCSSSTSSMWRNATSRPRGPSALMGTDCS